MNSLPKIALCYWLCWASFALLQAQTSATTSQAYKTLENVPYYEQAEGQSEYLRERCRLDLYYPEHEEGYATVVWFHGGGLKAGQKFIPERLKNQKLAIVAVNYRLHPKVQHPTYIEDAAASVAWVFKHIQSYGGDPDLIFVSGHSAGGYLSSMLGLDKRWLAKHEVNADRIAGLIPFSGHTITHFTIRAERNIAGTLPIIDEYAPLYHIRKDAPPCILITGDRELELLGRYEENAYFMRMMKVVGHPNTILYELDGFNHGGMAEPAFPLLLKHVKAIVNEKLAAAK